MQSDTKMLLQIQMSYSDLFVELVHSQLAIIGAIQNPVDAERLLASAAAKVRSAVYSADALADKIPLAERKTPGR